MVVVFGPFDAALDFTPLQLPAPGERVETADYACAAGGAGTTLAVAAARQGAAVTAAGALGRDRLGDLVLASLGEHGVDVTGLARWADAPTGCRVSATADNGRGLGLSALGANRLARGADLPTPGAGDVVLAATGVPASALAAAVGRAEAAGAPALVDMGDGDAVPTSVLGRAAAVVTGEGPARRLATRLGLLVAPPYAAAQALAHSLATTVVVTLGAQGVVAAHPEGLLAMPALQVATVDCVGAGAAFTGTLAVAWEAGQPMEEAIHAAGVAGALACTTAGCAALPSAEAVAARRDDLERPHML